MADRYPLYINDIGIRESIERFIERKTEILTTYPYASQCPNRNSDISEVKTSIFVAEILDNYKITIKLLIFLDNIYNNIKKNIMPEKPSILMETYFQELEDSLQNDLKDQYPIGQANLWYNNLDGITHDFYAMYNFLKWLWIVLKQRYNISTEYAINFNTDNINSDPSIKQSFLFYTIIELFQQTTFISQQILRGQREDFENSEIPSYKKSTQIGITGLNIPELRKKETNGKKTEPWVHPGKTTCVPQYNGKYGTLLKEYKQTRQDDFYSSLQCGLSASTQYTLFLYLMSICQKDTQQTKEEADIEVDNVILTTILVLTGDGGHNMREILFGLTSTIILLKNFISYLHIELQKPYPGQTLKQISNIITMDAYNAIKNSDGNHLLNIIVKFIEKFEISDDIKLETFKFIIKACYNWEPFITSFYTLTQDINITGVDSNDILSRNIPYNNLENIFYDFYNFICSSPSIRQMFNSEWLNNAQVFFSLENNRYLLNTDTSFKTIADVKIKELLSRIVTRYKLNGDIEDNINNFMHYFLNRCEKKDLLPVVNYIPYAFSSKNKPNQRRRKSPQKSVQRRRKSPQKSVQRRRKSPKKSIERRRKSPQKSVQRRRKSPKKSIERRRKSPQKSVQRRRKSPQKSVQRRRKSPQKSVQSRRKSPQKSVQSRRKSPQKSVQRRRKSPQKSIERRRKSPQKSVQRRRKSPKKSIEKRRKLPQKSVQRRKKF
jgi:hypothetical protein